MPSWLIWVVIPLLMPFVFRAVGPILRRFMLRLGFTPREVTIIRIMLGLFGLVLILAWALPIAMPILRNMVSH